MLIDRIIMVSTMTLPITDIMTFRTTSTHMQEGKAVSDLKRCDYIEMLL